MIVISFMGPSAAGKSTALKSLKSKYEVLPEKYMDLNKHDLDNRLVVSKWSYYDYWFSGILDAHKKGVDLIITDRCPLDCCAYIYDGRDELYIITKAAISELNSLGINHYKVLVKADFSVLEKRIHIRLEKEKRRKKYNENDKEHNRKAYDFFESKINDWDFVIDTSKKSPSLVVEAFEETILKITE